jgi:HK97 family phage prohead protease
MTDAPKGLLTRAVTFETRAADDDGFTLEGYAAVFDTPTRIDSWEGRFDEQIARGAFKKTLSERQPVVQWDHGHDAATGSVPIAAIEEIREDDHGLFVRARMFDNARVEPIRQAIAGGAIDGMSFRFRVTREEWDEKRDEAPMRTIKELDLFELGPVAFPAYTATSVGVRSLLAELPSDERTRLLNDLGVDAARSGTSTPSPDAAPSGGTSGSTGTDPRAVAALAAAARAARTPRK